MLVSLPLMEGQWAATSTSMSDGRGWFGLPIGESKATPATPLVAGATLLWLVRGRVVRLGTKACDGDGGDREKDAEREGGGRRQC
ncbi:hypothetical protein E2562_005030 [Oryza meyeriana var. granulata]|uniref:Uncharacterized protein n=1 Tax=Oryza meyeriana var. granulata TaxID=110450 RepID=A0A6G1BS31_9ORYZ|nr:hypothetical protein E2562_005030 [Oryza meyeriana var. granulata]